MFRDIIEVETRKGSIINLTKRVSGIVDECHITEGLCNIFLQATTAGLVINENERMLLEDFRRFFNAIDENRLYNHPSNAFSHLRAALTKGSVTIPISNGSLLLGEWQDIMLWEFDVEDRKRRIIVTVTGD